MPKYHQFHWHHYYHSLKVQFSIFDQGWIQFDWWFFKINLSFCLLLYYQDVELLIDWGHRLRSSLEVIDWGYCLRSLFEVIVWFSMDWMIRDALNEHSQIFLLSSSLIIIFIIWFGAFFCILCISISRFRRLKWIGILVITGESGLFYLGKNKRKTIWTQKLFQGAS